MYPVGLAAYLGHCDSAQLNFWQHADRRPTPAGLAQGLRYGYQPGEIPAQQIVEPTDPGSRVDLLLHLSDDRPVDRDPTRYRTPSFGGGKGAGASP